MLPELSALIPINHPGAVVAENCLTKGPNYIPFQSLTESTAALPAACKGAFACKALDGTVYIFAGTDTKLYRYVGTAWVDVSRASNYSTGAENRWVFTQYGNIVVACNFANEMQSFTMGTSALFANVAGAPRAKVLAVVNNFVVAGHTFDAVDGTRRNRVQWCAINNPLDWANNPSVTQADFQDLPTGGEVQAISGYDNHAIITQESGFKRMEYVGPDLVFSITDAELVRGAVADGCVVSVGNQIFFYAEDGFYVFSAQNSVPIGRNKVDEWFKQNLKAGTEQRIISTYNPLLKIVAWGFESIASTTGIDTLLIYNWGDNRFTYVKENIQCFLVALTTSKGLEDLGAQYGGLENIPFGLDSEVWGGGRTLPGAFSSTNKLGYFNGNPMQAYIEGAEARLNPNGRTFVSSLYVNADAPVIDAYVLHRDNLSSAPTNGGLLPFNSATGEYNCRSENRFHRCALVLSGNWKYVQGVQYRAKAVGVR
jgi:hypothetical protein